MREIPLQRRYGIAGDGETTVPRTSRDDRSRPAESSPDLRTVAAASTEPQVVEEYGPGLEDPVGTGVDVPGDVEPSAAPAAGPLDGVGELEAPDLVRDGEEERPAAAAPDAGDLPSGDLRVLSDRAWAWMEPLLPTSAGRRGGRWRDHRQVVDAICWKYRTGSTWRELPARFGPWQTAYERATRWSADGTWARLLAEAQAGADADGELDWLAAVGSTAVRVPQQEAGARRVGGGAATATAADPEQGVAA